MTLYQITFKDGGHTAWMDEKEMIKAKEFWERFILKIEKKVFKTS